MRNFLIKAVLGLFIMLAISAASPQQAEAVKVQMTNPFSKTLSAAIIHYVDGTDWMIQGWYKIEPNSTKTFNFPNSTKREHVYIYAHTSDNSWESKPGSTSMKAFVISKAFKYFSQHSCPNGANRREVAFAMKKVGSNGIVTWKP